MKNKLLILLAATTLSACAKSPENIQGAYISPLQYSDYSCKQIAMEVGRTSRRLNQVIGVQDETASEDAVAMGVGLVLFWPALFFINGSDQEEEVARLKGEYEAIEEAAIQKECDIAPELKTARELAEKRSAEKRELEERARKDLN